MARISGGVNKAIGIVFLIILVAAMAPTAIGSLVNLTDVSGLPTWASTLMLLGGVISLVVILLPRK